MADDSHALAAPADAELAVIPDARLRPTTRTQETLVVLGAYLGLVIPASFMGFGALTVVLVIAFSYVMNRRRRWFRSMARQRDIQIALNNGDVAQASSLGRSLVMQGHRYALAHVCSVATWGTIELHRGNPTRAVELLQRVMDSGRFSGRIGRALETWRYVAALAYAHAIAGDVEAAQARLAAVDAEIALNRRDMLLTIRVFIMCRAGQFEEVIALFDTHWRTAETQLTVGGARTARMLEAFALEHRTADGYRSDESDRMRRALDRAREARPGAYEYLAVAWPELADFLSRHQLRAGPATG